MTISSKLTNHSDRKNAVRDGSHRRRLPKGERLIQLLKAKSGHDVSALSTKLGWQPHTTRAALSRLRQAGYGIEKLPALKQGGSRYRLSSAKTERAQ